MKITHQFNGGHKPAPKGDKRFAVPRWKSQVIGGRGKAPKKVTLAKVEMREVKA